MSTDIQIDSDLQRLATATLAPAPSLAQTQRVLHAARAERPSGRRRWAIAAAMATCGLALSVTHWSTVYAFARDVMFRVALDLRDKSDSQAADEIRHELDRQGWTASDVSVQRGDGEQRVIVRAESPTGRHIELRRVEPSGIANQVVLAPEPIDDTREPGMSDVQLREKILQQLRARGIEHPQVTVSGDDVRVLIKREVPE